ncbi:MAG: histidine triad nucleotide-binding protein [Deltaproteobacteria bacterium CG11_big_fil_rev_8_21_14_0_20_49_13]|nr:MAG: histidine triad nucleotide-binding protein [Deltaproteobacteria bacterium CG11_big_fil_rev_8_21_14_0_20_49_13]
MNKDDCIFCKIINGQIPSTFIYEDDKLIAFKDINPAAPTHILFVPKKHYATLNDIAEGDTIMSDLVAAVQKTAKKLGLHDRGYRVVTNVNREGGQVVFHLHVHMLGGRSLDDKMG